MILFLNGVRYDGTILHCWFLGDKIMYLMLAAIGWAGFCLFALRFLNINERGENEHK